MATFTGTDANEVIRPNFVSATVAADPPGSVPSDAEDRINAGGGSDLVEAGGGSNIVDLGAGDDDFLWHSFIGRNLLEGGDGEDELNIRTVAGAESTILTAMGGRGVFKGNGDTGAPFLDFAGIETISLYLLSGPDTLQIDNAAITGLEFLYVALGAHENDFTPDGEVDTIILRGGAARDTIVLGQASGAVDIRGMGPERILVDYLEGMDTLTLSGGGGSDSIDASAGSMPSKIILIGGGGNDRLLGSAAPDELFGDDGNDIVTGGAGGDLLILGEGDDQAFWNAGGGHDALNAGGGADQLILAGTTDDFWEIGLAAGGFKVSGIYGSVRASETEVVWFRGTHSNTYVISSLVGSGLQRLNFTPDSEMADFNLTGTSAADDFNLDDTDGATVILGLGAELWIDGGPIWVRVDAGDGNDVMDARGAAARSFVFFGGAGDDTFFASGSVDQVFGDSGQDTVDYSGSVAAVMVTLGGFDPVGQGFGGSADQDVYSEVENASGSAFDDVLSGNRFGNVLNGAGGADQLYGREDNDRLVGGGGSDRTDGGAGDDIHIVDNAADLVIERAGEGTDRVLAQVSYTLVAGAHVETLSTAKNAGIAAINLTGNGFANTLVGNAGANRLNGGRGIDTLNGLGGNDSFVVDHANDRVVEAAGGGADRVFASVSYTLGAPAQVETLSTLSSAATTAIDLTGNGFANRLIGNAGANLLNGGGGADSLAGLGGDDRYILDSQADAVAERAGGGDDRVFASASYALAAGVHVEILSTINTAAAAAINLAGNELANSLIGNAGDNILRGAAGNDTLSGLGAADALFGGAGTDRLVGGAGADDFHFDTALNEATNVDLIADFTTDDAIHLHRAIFAGIGADGTLATSAFRAGTAATAAGDRIIHDSATGNIFYDADGEGGAAQILFGRVAPGIVLAAEDFVAYSGPSNSAPAESGGFDPAIARGFALHLEERLTPPDCQFA